MKVLVFGSDNKLRVTALDLFVGSEFVISVHGDALPNFTSLRESSKRLRPDEVLSRSMDSIAESYLPLLEEIQLRVEALHGRVVLGSEANAVDQMNEIRGMLLELRRVLLNMRHVAFRLQHIRTDLIGRDLLPFFRDIHDHLAEDLDITARELDRLVGVLDTYLSTIAIRHTEAMRALTFLGTLILPALVISSFFGMNIRLPGWANSSWAFEAIVTSTFAITIVLWWYLKRRN